MQSGDIIADRFELEELAGSGGMGDVFRARDKLSGQIVAVKIVRDGRAPEEARFDREALVLSELRHPGIVRFIAHGVTDDARPYIVTEWLEGEDLANVLRRRRRLSVEESVTVIRGAAEALSEAHKNGIIHRDLKPSNLFLVGGDLTRVKLIDFGIAKLKAKTRLTQTGMTLGTPGYMAPEQARSGAVLDVRADVFALGCVLFECLTGQQVFGGEHVMAILAKILFDEAPRVREICPEVPPPVDALVARLLAKEPDDRPSDGAALAKELAGVLDFNLAVDDDILEAVSALSTELTDNERQLLSVVLMGPALSPERSNETTLGPTQINVHRNELRRAADVRGGRFELLADGSIIVTLSGTRVATDQAAQAARCALALRALSEKRPIALATGYGKVTGKLPTGDVIDRAARLLSARTMAAPRSVREAPDSDLPPPLSVHLSPIGIDEVTSGLLDARFVVRRAGEDLELHGERSSADESWGRTLLGKPTAFVGRDREIAAIETIFAESIEEPMAQAVLITAAPGMGKSRLLHEVVRQIKRRYEGVEVWVGWGDSLRAGSAFSLLGQALRGACGILDGESLAVRREKLTARMSRHLPPADAARAAEFLGELIGTPLPAESSAPLRAARQDAQLMGEQMRAAWEELVAAECSVRPVLLVLEDLHWGDLPTVRFIDAALGALKDRPFMVLASARPEVHSVFPKLWGDRRVHELRLKELTRKASERLVKQALGGAVERSTLERVVTQAEGNVLYLEELIRAIAEGRGDALPESVVAMVEARLEGLEGEARRLLRAASVFGEVFWEGGVMALLGTGLKPSPVGDWIAALVEREVLVRRPESRFPGERELSFRHTLLREGAYAMLTEVDRRLGHRLAGEWLERSGETDPMVLAEHFERGGDQARAGSYYLRAAEQAYRGGDSAAAIARAKKGLARGVSASTRVALLGLLCDISAWRSDWSTGAAHAEEVMGLARPGSLPWCRAMIAKLGDAMRLGDIDAFIAMLDKVRGVDPDPDAAGIVANTFVLSVCLLDSRGRIDFAEVILRRMKEFIGPIAERDPIARGWMHIPRAYHELWVNEDPWTAYRQAEAARASFLEANHRRGVMVAQIFLGMSAWCLGSLERAERELSAIQVADEELGVFASFRPFCLIGVLSDRGMLHEARREATQMIEGARARGVRLDEGRGRWALAEVLRRQGELELAEREALAARKLLAVAVLDGAAAATTLAAVQLAQGRAKEALETVEATMGLYEALRAFGFKGGFARLVYAEALLATGEVESATAMLSAGRERLLAEAARVTDPKMRRSFLRSVPEHARTLELLSEWPESELVMAE
ncbi:MAG TPA: protein kinase [Polyangiaceae bacterium]|jgi:serine/threonine protein kinase/tetratricopeptide (TPR) repeat protein|nr:protein kinase [Polyangiaceae bacterium]